MWAAAWLGVRVPSATLLSIAGNSANSCKYFLSAQQAWERFRFVKVCGILEDLQVHQPTGSVYVISIVTARVPSRGPFVPSPPLYKVEPASASGIPRTNQ